MAVSVFYNAYASVNGVNLSDHVESVRLEWKADMLEKTAMSNDTHVFVAGLFDWSIEISFYQDYAAGSVDATLAGLLGAAAFTLEIRPDAGAVGATNPRFSGAGVSPGSAVALLESYSPITGGVGTLQKTSAKFRPAAKLVRQTS